MNMDIRVQRNIGKIFGDFEVIGYENRLYFCKCIHCGYERTYTSQALNQVKKGKKAMLCGCKTSGIKKGDRFGRLVAIERDLERAGTGRVYWKFKCDCGNIVSHSSHELKSGNTQSCGCLGLEVSKEKINKILSELEDLTGKKFDLLTVLRLASSEECANRPKGVRYWYCLCECGNNHIAATSDLKTGKVRSCGCLNSRGEQKITKILTENNYRFAKQFFFEDLKNSYNERHYFYDFGILDENNVLQYLIEFDGIQHFSSEHQFGKDGEESFKQIQERDKIKNHYCWNHNIPLIRIPYTKLESLNINDLDIKTTKFLLTRGNENGFD